MNTALIPVKQLEDRSVNLLIVYNALNLKDRELEKLVYDPDKTLADYMEGLPEPEQWSVSVNAELFEMSEWALVHPAPDDYITVMPIPYGGGGKGKNVLRLAAMIVVSIYAPQLSGAMAKAMSVTSAAAINGMTAGIMVAGSMLVNAMMPTAKASTSATNVDNSESPTYGVDGAKNTSLESAIVPLIYGEFRYAGNIVNLSTENRGNEQIIYAQMVVSEGEVESISDFEVEDQPASNYEDIDTVVRLGGSNQSIVGWFASAMAMRNKSVTLGSDWTTHTTVGEVDGFRVDVVLPQGLSNINDKDGKRYNRSVSMAIQYRRVGTSTWTNLFDRQFRPLPSTSIPQGSDRLRVEYHQRFTGSGFRDVSGTIQVREAGGSWRTMDSVNTRVNLNGGSGFLSGAFNVNFIGYFNYTEKSLEYRINWTAASPTVLASARYPLSPTLTSKTAQPIRRSFLSGVLPEGVYEIRIRRTNNESTSDMAFDRVVLSDVGEIINERVRYNHTAFYGVRVRVSDQLNGLPRMTAKVRGIKVAHFNYAKSMIARKWSANPAWITLDILTSKRYGAGMPLSRIDIRKFVEWAEFCDKNKLYFNGVLDTFSNVWDACQLILRVGHARFATIGNSISLSIYQPSQPVMMFGAGNIIEGSLQLNWQSIEDRSNEFEIEFYDRENRNRQNTVRVVSEEAIARGEMQRIASIRMVGVDNQRQALHEAHFQKALNEALIMSGSFDASIDAISCGVGDVVLLQSDMPEWGESGRIKPGSTRTKIIVDMPLSIDTTPQRSSMLILHPAIRRGTARVGIVTPSTSTVYLTGIPTNTKCRRLKAGDKDIQVINTAPSGGYLEVTLDTVAGLAVGQTVELWDTDVIESRKIQSYDPETNEVTLAGPLTVDPEELTNYMVGETNAEAKPVSITGIDHNGDYRRTIKFIEYNETVFDPVNVRETPLYSPPVREVLHVQDLRVEEQLTTHGTSLVSDILIAWNAPTSGGYAGARVYISRNDENMAIHGTAGAGATSYPLLANMGETLAIRVVAYDGAGRSADYDSAPYWEHVVMGASEPPSAPTDFKVEKGIGGVEFSWTRSNEIDVVGYEIREGASWDAGKTIVEDYGGTRFFTTNKQGGFYTYHIKARDTLGNLSENSSVATLVLPAPSVVVGFNSVQNGDSTILEWRRNSEVDIAGYEIRQGSVWANSQHVVFVSGTSWAIPVGATSIDSYLIKAYDTAGVESHVAARVNQAVYRSQSYNAVHEVDATELGYPGMMVGLAVVDGKLESEDSTGTAYAEYIQPIDMGKRYNATVTTTEILAAKSDEIRTWKDMNYTWGSPRAAGPWFPTAEVDDLSMTKEIALYVGKKDNEIVTWSMDDLTGAPNYGSGLMTLDNVSKTLNGRYGDGVLVNPASRMSIEVNSGNTATWWARPAIDMIDVCEVIGSTGSARAFVDRNELVVTSGSAIASSPIPVKLSADRHYFIAVSVVSGKVLVYLRCLEDASEVMTELSANIGVLRGIEFV